MGCTSSTEVARKRDSCSSTDECKVDPLVPQARAFASLRTCSMIGDPFIRALTQRTSHRNQTKTLSQIHHNVLCLLNDEWPSLKNSSLLGTWRQRDSLMRSIGPPMLLLHWETIERLGRIPHSSEGHGISMEQAAEIAAKHSKRFFIEMFSHRWCSQGQPDDDANSKASVLIQWVRYRWTLGLATFFWVDYTCIDQDDIAPGVCMLPLYVASCNNIICYDTPEYEPRAWCRVERLLFTAFVAPNNEFISPDFTFDASAPKLPNNELKPHSEQCSILPDPESGQLTSENDSELIKELKSLCGAHWGKCWKDGLLNAVSGKLDGVRSLELGTTQVRLRRFTSSQSTMQTRKAAPQLGKGQEHVDDTSTAFASDGDDLELVSPQVSLNRASSSSAMVGPSTENQSSELALGLVMEEEEDAPKHSKLDNIFASVGVQDEQLNAREIQLVRSPEAHQHDCDLAEEKLGDSWCACGFPNDSENVQLGVEEFEDFGAAMASPHKTTGATSAWTTAMFCCGPATVAPVAVGPPQVSHLQCC